MTIEDRGKIYSHAILGELIGLSLINTLWRTNELTFNSNNRLKHGVTYSLDDDPNQNGNIKEKCISFNIAFTDKTDLIFTVLRKDYSVKNRYFYKCIDYLQYDMTSMLEHMHSSFLENLVCDKHAKELPVEDNTKEPPLDYSIIKEIVRIDHVGTSDKYNVIFKDNTNYFVITDSALEAKPGDFAHINETKQISFLPKNTLQ